MKRLLEKLISAVSSFACLLPEKQGMFTAKILGFAASKIWRNERKRLFDTIDRAYFRMKQPLPMPMGTIIELTFVHFALDIYELLRYPLITEAELLERFVMHGLENLDKALAGNRGVILAVPHLGNWELLGGAIAARGYKLHSFYLAQKEDELGDVLDKLRACSKMILHDRDRGAISALKALKHGEILGMVADQDGGNTGVYLDFLGHWVSMPAGIANWSLKTGASVIPLYNLRRGLSNRFDAYFEPALNEPDGNDYCDKAIARTLEITRWFEKLILANPWQYLWFYDRFKPRHEARIAHMKRAGISMQHGKAAYVVGDVAGDST